MQKYVYVQAHLLNRQFNASRTELEGIIVNVCVFFQMQFLLDAFVLLSRILCDFNNFFTF